MLQKKKKERNPIISPILLVIRKYGLKHECYQ